MSEFTKDLNAAKTSITRLFSSDLALKFENIVTERQYTHGQQIIGDLEKNEDQGILNRLQINDEKESKLFYKLFIQIFKLHHYEIDLLKLFVTYLALISFLCFSVCQDKPMLLHTKKF